MTNIIVKKTHTFVKANTPCCHKIKQKYGFTQKVAFLKFYVYYCIVLGLPTVVQILQLVGSTCSKKKSWLGGHFFRTLMFTGLQHPGHVSPSGSKIVQLKYHTKSRVIMNMEFGREYQMILWQGVYFLLFKFYKNHRKLMLY